MPSARPRRDGHPYSLIFTISPYQFREPLFIASGHRSDNRFTLHTAALAFGFHSGDWCGVVAALSCCLFMFVYELDVDASFEH